MAVSSLRKHVVGLDLLLLLALTLLLLPTLVWSQVTQSVRLPNQEYTESSQDLRVKVLGGHVCINRSWSAGNWHLNPAWSNLRFVPDPLGGVLAIDRAGSMYKRTAGGSDSAVYAFGPNNFITEQENGWRWHDRLGHSVHYDSQGRILSYANPAGVAVHFGYGANGVIDRVLDHHGTQVLQASYRSDPFGRRISKIVSQGASQTTWFIYSAQGLMAEADEAGKLTRAYGFNPVAAQQGLWSTDPIWQANVINNGLNGANAEYHYLHTDHLGTTKEGTTSWKAVSEAFGAAGTLPESSIEMNLRLPGQYFDKETGNHYNFNRDYRPNLGRYVQSDPIGLLGGANLFSYAINAPTYATDSHGLSPSCDMIGDVDRRTVADAMRAYVGHACSLQDARPATAVLVRDHVLPRMVRRGEHVWAVVLARRSVPHTGPGLACGARQRLCGTGA